MSMSVIIFAYFGPESMLPLTSVVATVVGVFLMFGRNTIRLARRAILGRLTSIGRNRAVPMPHFHVEAAKPSALEATRP